MTNSNIKGGRPSTGTLVGGPGHYSARLTMPDGSRETFPLPSWYSEEQARTKCAELARAVRLQGVEGIAAVEIPKSETFEQWSERWLTDRDEHRGLTSVRDDRSTEPPLFAPHDETLDPPTHPSARNANR
jgi:hypothetical protein